MIVTEIYKVYGCNDEGRPHVSAEFYDFKSACQYAVAQYGKIHYNLPEVVKYTYHYDEEKKAIVNINYETIKPEQIHYMNKI